MFYDRDRDERAREHAFLKIILAPTILSLSVESHRVNETAKTLGCT